MLLKPRWYAGMTVAAVTPQLVAQVPVASLTGKPAAVLSTPFVFLSSLVQLGNGSVIFYDRSEQRLTLADLEHDRVQRIGMIGSGPNEYRSPGDPVRTPDGGALIPDRSNSRGLLVSPNGTIIRTAYTREELVTTFVSNVRGVDSAGGLLVYTSTGASADSLPIGRWDPATRKVTTLAWWPVVHSTLGPPVTAANGMVSRSLHQSMWPMRPAWVALPDGSVALVRPRPYRVDVTAPNGVTHVGPVIPYQPIKVTDAERGAVEKERGGTIPPSDFPAEKPPFEGLNDVFASPDGRIWVGRMRAWNDSVPTYDVFDRSGRLAARVVLKPNSRVVGFGKGTVYVARQTTDDDYWHLERYTIGSIP